MNDNKEQSKNREHKTRILIVDDDAIMRQGLKKLVDEEPDLVVCAEAGSAYEALNVLEKQQIDLAIVNICLEGTSVLELTERMKLCYPYLIVLILSMYDELPCTRSSLRDGAAERIIDAIRHVLSGKIYISDSKAVKTMSDAASISGDSPNANRVTKTPLCNKSERRNPKYAQF
jgi:DNA-binding NarL/FixJ family response regulator